MKKKEFIVKTIINNFKNFDIYSNKISNLNLEENIKYYNINDYKAFFQNLNNNIILNKYSSIEEPEIEDKVKLINSIDYLPELFKKNNLNNKRKNNLNSETSSIKTIYKHEQKPIIFNENSINILDYKHKISNDLENKELSLIEDKGDLRTKASSNNYQEGNIYDFALSLEEKKLKHKLLKLEFEVNYVKSNSLLNNISEILKEIIYYEHNVLYENIEDKLLFLNNSNSKCFNILESKSKSIKLNFFKNLISIYTNWLYSSKPNNYLDLDKKLINEIFKNSTSNNIEKFLLILLWEDYYYTNNENSKNSNKTSVIAKEEDNFTIDIEYTVDLKQNNLESEYNKDISKFINTI